MIKFIIVSSLIAICAASEDIFFSEKYVPKDFYPSATIHNGSYYPKLDHFRPQDDRIVTFHYRINIDNYRAGGPLFFYIHDGAENPIQWIDRGLMVDVARETQGALIQADMRYMGLNIPTASATFEEFEFFTMEQAVADIAVLVRTLHEHLATDNPRIILWGTGLGATLATFARKKYPHLIDGVFASSGNFRAEVFDTSYHDNLSSNLRVHGGDVCFRRVQNAFDVLEYLFENGETLYVQQRLNLCNEIDTNNTQQIGILYQRMIDLISEHIRNFNLFGLESFCRDMNYFPADTLNSFVRWAVHVYGSGSDTCINTHYPYIIEELRETEWNETDFPGSRAQGYLRCSQLAAFRIASDYEFTAFPSLLDAEYHFQWCEDIFGEEYNRDLLVPAVDNLNTHFGGQEQVVPFVLFTNAGLDPWISHGVSEYDQENGGVIFIYFSAAGQDLTSISAADSIELTRAKQEIFATMVDWATRS